MPDPKEIVTLRTFSKGLTCNLTFSYFLGRTSKKNTLYKFSSLLGFSFIYLCLCGEVGGGGIADDHAIAGIASEGDGEKET